MITEELHRIWSAVYGHPAWSVQKGHGSFLTLEFGQPELRIREPKTFPSSSSLSEKAKESFARRLVTVTGQWHLWIYCCNWSIILHGKELAHSESPDETIASSTFRLDGQELLAVEQGATQGEWRFVFDLGGELRTWPYQDEPPTEQWMLFERGTGYVLVAESDGSCSYGPGNIRRT
ncbi:MAG: hypothetical protein ACTHJ1_03235 [Bordetella sp.]|uniref:hypothetical protein n=1 Tax=Bordetella sp. TaxID=28081 RepID=UPI003F7BF118